MSDTPRTDAEYARLHSIYLDWASRKEMCCAFENDMQLARQLERELNATKEAFDEANFEIQSLKETIRDQEDHIRELQSMRRYTPGYTAEP